MQMTFLFLLRRHDFNVDIVVQGAQKSEETFKTVVR
jgi:hypothetical protein